MHFIFTYIIYLQDSFLRNRLNDKIIKIISGFDNVRAIENTYVVEIKSKADWKIILNKLIDLSKSHPKIFHFIMSPPMKGGSFNGFLPENIWKIINKFCIDDFDDSIG